MVSRPTRRALLSSITLGVLGSGTIELSEGSSNTIQTAFEALDSGDVERVPLPARGTAAGFTWSTTLSNKPTEVVGVGSTAGVIRTADGSNYIVNLQTGDIQGVFETPYEPEFNESEGMYYAIGSETIDGYDANFDRAFSYAVPPETDYTSLEASSKLLNVRISNGGTIRRRATDEVVWQGGEDESCLLLGDDWFVTGNGDSLLMRLGDGQPLVQISASVSLMFPESRGWFAYGNNRRIGAIRAPSVGPWTFLTGTEEGLQLRTPHTVKWRARLSQDVFGHNSRTAWALIEKSADAPAQLWEFDLKTGERLRHTLIPGGYVSVSGTFMLGQDERYVLGYNDRIEAYEPRNRTTVWTTKLSDVVSISEYDESVVVLTDEDSGQRAVILNAESGERTAQYSLPDIGAATGSAEGDGPWIKLSVEEHTVLIHASGDVKPIILPISSERDSELSYIESQRSLIVETDKRFWVFNARTGDRRWTQSGTYWLTTDNGLLVYTSFDEAELGVRAVKSGRHWQLSLNAQLEELQVQSEALLVQLTAGDDLSLVDVYDVSTGKRQARFDRAVIEVIGYDPNRFVIIGENRTYLPTQAAVVPVAQEALSSEQLAIASGSLLCYDVETGYVKRYALKSGQLQWRTACPWQRTLHVYGQTVFAVGSGWTALDLETGSPLYSWLQQDTSGGDIGYNDSTEGAPEVLVATSNRIQKLGGVSAAVDRAPNAVEALRTSYPSDLPVPEISSVLTQARTARRSGNIRGAALAYSQAYCQLWRKLYAYQRARELARADWNQRLGLILIGSGHLPKQAKNAIRGGDLDRGWRLLDRLVNRYRIAEGVTTGVIGFLVTAIAAPISYRIQKRREPDRSRKAAESALRNAGVACGHAHTSGRALAHYQYALQLFSAAEYKRAYRHASFASSAARIEKSLLTTLMAGESPDTPPSELFETGDKPNLTYEEEIYVGTIAELVRIGRYREAYWLLDEYDYLKTTSDSS